MYFFPFLNDKYLGFEVRLFFYIYIILGWLELDPKAHPLDASFNCCVAFAFSILKCSSLNLSFKLGNKKLEN